MTFSYIIHIGILSGALLIGALLRSKVKFIQHFLIPSSIIGGFFLLVTYNFITPHFGLSSDFLGELVFHLLNISFIAMMLRHPEKKEKSRAVSDNVIAILLQYGFQVAFGLILTLVLIYTVYPDLFPAFGLALPLGFELGPGQAYSISLPWESMGFEGATSVGLALAAIGFLVGSIGGVILINIGVAHGWVDAETAAKLRSRGVRTGFLSKDEMRESSKFTTDSESIDSFTYHIALVMVTYILSSLVLLIVEKLLSFIGPLGVELANSLWGVNFIFSTFVAAGVRQLMIALHIHHTVDDGTLNRINGLSVDLTVAASLGSISLVAIASYTVPIILLTLVGIVITCIILPFYASRLYDDHKFYRMLLLFGTATGTLPTGLSLLRVVDPDFKTPVAQDYVYAAGPVFFLVLPIIVCANLPAYSYVQNNPLLFYALLGLSLLYTFVCIVLYIIRGKEKAFGKMRHLFYR